MKMTLVLTLGNMPIQLLRIAILLAVVFHCAAVGWGASIAYRPALIPTGGPPVPVPLAIEPPMPTTNDTIQFTAPLDGMVRSNSCVAAAALGGYPVLHIDQVARTIDITFDGNTPEVCLAVYDPVLGAFGQFGKLSAGDWVFNNSQQVGLFFTVAAAPLASDFNDDGKVDAGDYTIWRDSLGATGLEPFELGDATGDGQVTSADYELWRSQFGTTNTASAVSSAQSVPEPTALVALLCLVASSFVVVRRRTRNLKHSAGIADH